MSTRHIWTYGRKLQWSHVPKDVERKVGAAGTPPVTSTSMEPRPEGRGEVAALEAGLSSVDTSMEPRPEGRGEQNELVDD